MIDKLKDVFDNMDFDGLMNLVMTGEWHDIELSAIASNKLLIAVIVLLVVFIGYLKTRELAVKIARMLAVGVFYGIGGVTLKNSSVHEIGPFLLAMTLFFAAFGYMFYTKVFRS